MIFNLLIILISFYVAIQYKNYLRAMLTFYVLTILYYIFATHISDTIIFESILNGNYIRPLIEFFILLSMFATFYLFKSKVLENDFSSLINNYFQTTFSKGLLLLALIVLVPNNFLIVHVSFFIVLALIIKLPQHIIFFLIFCGEIINLVITKLSSEISFLSAAQISVFDYKIVIFCQLIILLPMIYLFAVTHKINSKIFWQKFKNYRYFIIFILSQIAITLFLTPITQLEQILFFQIIVMIILDLFLNLERANIKKRVNTFPLVVTVVIFVGLIIIYFYSSIIVAFLLSQIILLTLIVLTFRNPRFEFVESPKEFRKKIKNGLIAISLLAVASQVFIAIKSDILLNFQTTISEATDSTIDFFTLISNGVLFFGNISEFSIGALESLTNPLTANVNILFVTIILLPLFIFNFVYFWYMREQLESKEENIKNSLYGVIGFYLIMLIMLILLF